MPTSVSTKFAGLWVQPNDMGSIPDGALAVADNCVLSRDNILETRRGFENIASKSLVRLFQFVDNLIGQSSAGMMSWSANGESWGDFSGTYLAPTGHPMRAALASDDLFFTASDAVKRLESVSGTPASAGLPPMVVASAFFNFSSSTAIGPDTQVAYRTVLGRRDARGRLILGAPSGRATVVNPGYLAASVVRLANVVTVTFSAVPGLVIGALSTINVSSVDGIDDAGFPGGDKSVTWTTSTTFTYAETGADATASVGYRASAPASSGTVVVVLPPSGEGAATFFQVYRAKSSINSDIPADDELALAAEGPIPSAATTATLTHDGAATVTVVTASPHGFTYGGYFRVGGNSANFPGGVKFVTVTGASTFRYGQASPAVAGTETSSRTVTQLAMYVIDQTPDELLGEPLYTNGSQEGAIASNYPPPIAADVVTFRQCLFAVDVTRPATLQVQLLGGVVNADTISVGGVTYTFSNAGPNYDTGVVQVGSGGTPAQNIALTARNLCTVIAFYSGSTVNAFYASGDNDPPGRIRLESRSSTATMVFGPASRVTSWSPADTTSVAPDSRLNGIEWSKLQQPDSFTVSNRSRIGASDRAAMRGLATRDSLFIIKDKEGIWRLTGSNPADFRIDPFDYNTHLFAPETAFVLDNKIFMLTEQGVAAVTDTGVELVSRSIETALFPLMAGAMAAVTRTLAYAIGVESDRKYILFLPTVETDTACTQAYVYDLITQGWTRWVVGGAHGLSNQFDDRLYLVDGSDVLQERKSLNEFDFADESFSVSVTDSGTASQVTVADATGIEVGDVISQGAPWGIVTAINGTVLDLDRDINFAVAPATVYRAIPVAVEPALKFSPPGMYHHFREASLSFRAAFWAVARLLFATDLSPALEERPSIPGWDGEQDHPTARFSIPRNKARGSWLRLRWEHSQAWSRMQMQAMSVTFDPGNTAVALQRQKPNTSNPLAKPTGSSLGG